VSVYESEDAYWRFARTVLWHQRYVREREANEFLSALLKQAAEKVETIPEGSILWRAQLGHDWISRDEHVAQYEEPIGFPPERMKPLRDRAVEGRANPKGIPYLYVATQRDTALAEVRPWVGADISAAQLRVLRDLRVVDCTRHEKHSFLLLGLTPEEHWDDDVWADVDDAFSRPVTLADDSADYVPTQVIAELFKSGGFDGVAYASAVGEGHNIALFDLDAVAVHGCAVHSLKSIEFTFEQSSNSYVVSSETDSGSG